MNMLSINRARALLIGLQSLALGMNAAFGSEADPVLEPSPIPSPAPKRYGTGLNFDTPIEIHGFVSQGFIATPHANFLRNTKEGSFNWTEVGLNFTKPLSDRLRLGVQLFARDFSELGDFDAQVDWFYLRYKWSDYLGLQAGRLKIPFGLYNDSSDIDAARVPILLPQSVYPIRNRDYVLAQTGIEVFGYADLGLAGALDYRLYTGTIPLEPSSSPVVTNYYVPYLYGGRLLWETPLRGLRLGGSIQFLRLTTDLTIGGTTLTVRAPVRLWIGSVEYSVSNWLFSTEYSLWNVESISTQPQVFPNGEATAERAYAMVSYRVTDWFQPGAYYAVYYPNRKNKNGRENQRHDLTATLRFDITPNWLVKVEGHLIHGTVDLDPAANDNVPNNRMDPNWGIFAVKTTAYF